ncbi:MAG TPA: hypothetical protein PL193_12430 [Xanthobacteraceae bacterium]|nr:hypothetical protein [Xanthobacteraceae bacterium]
MTQAKGNQRNKWNKRVLGSLAAAALVLAAAPAIAGTSRGFENGGYFTRFDPVVAEFNETRKPFRIVGLCQSACTLFLSIRNVCVERTARFEFHAGSDGKGNILQSATQHMIDAYNPKLRRFVIQNGYMETLAFSAISADDMIDKFGYTECTPEHRLASADDQFERSNGYSSEGSYSERPLRQHAAMPRNEGSYRSR